MAVEISDRNNQSQQMVVNKDGSINVRSQAGTESDQITLRDLKNESVEEVLGNILKQLKIMNLHLSILTDNTIKNTEV